MEEYIEGLSFLHYLEKRELITMDEVQATLSDAESGTPVSSISAHRVKLMVLRYSWSL